MENNVCRFDRRIKCSKEQCPNPCPVFQDYTLNWKEPDYVAGYDCEDYDE